MKILLAMPTLNTINVKTVKSLLSMLYHPMPDAEITIKFLQDSLTYTARDELARMAMNDNYDYVLWIDSDMTFPADSLVRLMAHDKDMVTGLYFQRKGEHKPVIYCSLGDDGAEVYAEYPKDSLFMICGCGFGMVLMRTEVLRRITQRYHLLFHPMVGLGEDLSFCNRWLSCGGEIWCDSSLNLGHVGENEFTEDDWHG